jgi:hypothetical protein
MNMAGDAAGTSLPMLSEQEATEAAMTVLPCRIRKYGIPQALCCDHKNAFAGNREPGVEGQLAGLEPQSHFGKACANLGIQAIAADSGFSPRPQAKGRAGRNRAVYQDRFVKELRLAGISTIEEANKFLEETYLPSINAKFARPPACNENGHAPLGNADLRGIFCFEERRVASRGFIAGFQRRLFQITPGNRPLPRPGGKVTVRVRLDKTIDLYFQNQKLSVMEIHKTTKKEAA